MSILPLITVIMIVAATTFAMLLVMQYLQHHFWRSHRLTDLRLEAINQLTWLLAEFLTNYIADDDYAPSTEFCDHSGRQPQRRKRCFRMRRGGW